MRKKQPAAASAAQSAALLGPIGLGTSYGLGAALPAAVVVGVVTGGGAYVGARWQQRRREKHPDARP